MVGDLTRYGFAAVLGGLIATVFLFPGTGVETSRDAFAAAENHPSVQYFKERHTIQQVSATSLSREAVQASTLFQQYCANTTSSRYWQVEYATPEEDTLLVWVSAETGSVTCLNQDFAAGGEKQRIGIRQNRTLFSASPGNLVETTLYIYAVGVNTTYYAAVKPVEKPDWNGFTITPSNRLYDPAGRPSFYTNVELPSLPSTLQKPEESPPHVTYIPVEDSSRFLPAATVTWQIRVPRQNPVGEESSARFPVTLNVSLQRFQGNTLEIAETHRVNYTITVSP